MSLADELEKLRTLYEAKTAAAAAAAEAGKQHKAQEQAALTAFKRERQESARPAGLGYTFTAVNDKERGYVSDRNLYYRWALEQEPSLEEFFERYGDNRWGFRDDLFDALLNLSILKLAESQRTLNATVKRCHDDEQPLPPGVDFEPVPYISVTKA